MFDRFSSVRDVLIRLCLGVFVFVVSGCGQMADGMPVQAVSTCVSPNLNPYRSHFPPNQVTDSYTNYKNGSLSYETIRQDALSRLGENIKQWSDYEDMIVDGRTVRIMVTYLDPMLIQYIVLNDVLVNQNNSLNQDRFTDQIKKVMERLVNRNEVVFVVTVTSQIYESPLYVDIPIESLKLVSTSGRRILPTHHDPILGEHNDVSQKPVYGYVGYPVSLLSQGSCGGVVDQWTTTLTLDYKSSLQQDHPYYPLFWNIPYQPLVVLEGNSRPIPTTDPFINPSRYSKSDAPPPPEMLTIDGTAKIYWEDMGRYIWSKVIMMSD